MVAWLCEGRRATRRAGAVHVETSRSRQTLADGTERVYQRHLLRRSCRGGGKVRKQTLANLLLLPDAAIEAVRLVLAGTTLVDADAGLEATRSLGHGHVAAVHQMARGLGFPALLGPPCPQRDLAYALVVSRVARPASTLSTIGRWDDVSLGDLAKIASSVDAGRLKDPAAIGVKVGKVTSKRKAAKHLTVTISEATLAWSRDQASIDAEAALDGIYVIRTPVPATQLAAATAVEAYKDLSGVEQDFRTCKHDLDLRPIWHRLEDRVRAHVLICMLACHLTRHLRKAWAPLTYADEHPPARDNPLAPARRSRTAHAKAAHKVTASGEPARSFRDLIDHPHPPNHHHPRPPDRQDHHPHPRTAGGLRLLGTPIPTTLQ